MIFSYLLNMQSHPSWVCGLKQSYNYAQYTASRSHPSWVCGLKLPLGKPIEFEKTSHPSWVCGLKPDPSGYRSTESQVTPLVGVWIETNSARLVYQPILVTPLVGVWIETLVGGLFGKSNTSHPSWVCGLKLFENKESRIREKVTPLVGVWIETSHWFYRYFYD